MGCYGNHPKFRGMTDQNDIIDALKSELKRYEGELGRRDKKEVELFGEGFKIEDHSKDQEKKRKSGKILISLL